MYKRATTDKTKDQTKGEVAASLSPRLEHMLIDPCTTRHREDLSRRSQAGLAVAVAPPTSERTSRRGSRQGRSAAGLPGRGPYTMRHSFAVVGDRVGRSIVAARDDYGYVGQGDWGHVFPLAPQDGRRVPGRARQLRPLSGGRI